VLPAVLLGKFNVRKVLGRGGMGVVYLGEDIALGRGVAIKTLPRVSLEQVRRLRGEARAMAAVTHPNLAVIYGAETWRGTPLLIVEYLAGGTLADRLRKQPMALEEVVALGVALSAALERMHRMGMLHRDVKPSNVGYADDGTPKLLDFGLARLLGRSSGDTQPGVSALTPTLTDLVGASAYTHLSGTPLYLSPEAVSGAAPDVSVDLWSLTVMLFEALTGICPFQGTSIADVFERIRRSNPEEICRALDDYPSAIGDFFRRELSRDAVTRVGSAAGFGRELARLRGALL
jgi:serine/threonine protein kinase